MMIGGGIVNDRDLLDADDTDGRLISYLEVGLTVSNTSATGCARMNDPPGELMHRVTSEVPAWLVVADDKWVWKFLDRRRFCNVQQGNTHTLQIQQEIQFPEE